MQRLLVFGGAGYVGSHFVWHALQAGYQLAVFDNLSTGHSSLLHPKAEFFEGDLKDAGQIQAAILKFQPDALFHFAANSLVSESVSDPSKYYHENVKGTLNLLDVLKEHSGKIPLVFSSTCAVYGKPQVLPITESSAIAPISPYGKTKAMCESMMSDFAKAYGVKAMALRYFNAAGADKSGKIGEAHLPETHLIPNILNSFVCEQEFEVYGDDYETSDGSCIRDYIHVTDLAKAHLSAALFLYNKCDQGYFDAINLGSGSGFSVFEIIKASEEMAGKKADFVIRQRREGDPPKLVADIKKAKEVLSFQLEHSDLATVIGSAWAWHKSSLLANLQKRTK